LIQGLHNFNLAEQPTFDDATVTLINKFIQLQKEPVCLVAHNGNKFDFPILKAAVNDTGQELSSKLLCVDSLDLFQQVFARQSQMMEEDTSDTHTQTQEKVASFRLGAVYKACFGEEIVNAHSAEADCLALVRIFNKKFNVVADWIDKHAIDFLSISAHK